MTAKQKNAAPTKKTAAKNPDLNLAFDVGHSSLGWSVLQTNGSATVSVADQPEVLGCGAVIFRADDCLASARRGYRRQRRHIRSTRQRILRMKLLLKHLGVLSEGELNSVATSSPWKLAASVLATNGQLALSWKELWDVLRWYAHNRGYDGNRRWSAAEIDTQEEQEDTEKLENAKSLLQKHGVKTMAETFCKELGVDPVGKKSSSTIRFKGLNAAFPREGVEKEVRRILQAHFKKLKGVDANFERVLCGRDNRDKEAWQAIPCPAIKLPNRYEGGLLFGQLVPRFDNRIISKCPVTGEKVPSRNCREFLNFRWAMQLANVRVARNGERELRPLTVDERKRMDALMRQKGSMTKKQFADFVNATTVATRSNLETMLMHPDAEKALEFDLVQKELTSGYWATLFPKLPERIQKRARGQLRRSRVMTLGKLYEQTKTLGESVTAFDTEIQRLLDSANTRKSKKAAQLSRNSILSESASVQKLSGRATYSRPTLQKAYEEVMAGKHPKEEGGCLFVSEKMKEAQLQREIDDQTNNHLVRHRLRLLERLQRDIIKEYANGDKSRIGKITIELARDLQETSGMGSKEKAKKEFAKLQNHKEVSQKLAEALVDSEGKPLRDAKGKSLVSAPLIRKARIAHDLNLKCPYTGRDYEFRNLTGGNFDLDHVIPRSQRLSDALASLVITTKAVNAEKKQRTALQFIREMNHPENLATRDRLGVWTETKFREFVAGLWPSRDPFKRSRAGGPRPTDDEARCWRRKEFLLTEKWEEKDFTPADLANTRVVTKFASLRLEKEFADLPQDQRPQVIDIPGAVTAAFRDKVWKLLNELQAVHPEVKRVLDEGEKVKAQGKDFNPKKAIRDVTHLHHAVDAIALALVTAKIVPHGGRAGLDGHFARWIVKGKLNPEERRRFEEKRYELRLPKFYSWRTNGEGGALCIDELTPAEKEQIRKRLAEKRVVQHIPAKMSGLRVEENTRGVEKIEKGRVYLRQQKRDEKTNKIKINRTDEAVGKALGLSPEGKTEKLLAIKGVRVISDNFGVAILDHSEEQEKLIVIPYHKVWARLQHAKSKNRGRFPRVLRIGSLVRVPNKSKRSDYRGLWMIRGVQINQKQGVLVDLSAPDTIEYRVAGRDDCAQNVRLNALLEGELEIIKPNLTGVPCPTTSSV